MSCNIEDADASANWEAILLPPPTAVGSSANATDAAPEETDEFAPASLAGESGAADPAKNSDLASDRATF